jgi:hypothetical protein
MITVWYDKNKKNLKDSHMFNLLDLTQEEKDFLKDKGMKFKLESYSQKGRYKFWSGRQVKHSDIQMIKTYYIRLYDKDNNKLFSVNIDRYLVAKSNLKSLMANHEQ